MKALYYSDELLAYSTKMFDRNLKVFSQNLYTPIDFVHEAFLLGYEDVESGKKKILNQILNEKRRLIAKIQQSENRGQFDVRDKKCCKCKLPKPIAEFAPRMDKGTGFQYYDSYCTECRREIQRAAYAKSEKMKESNKLRQRAWWRRHHPLCA